MTKLGSGEVLFPPTYISKIRHPKRQTTTPMTENPHTLTMTILRWNSRVKLKFIFKNQQHSELFESSTFSVILLNQLFQHTHTRYECIAVAVVTGMNICER